IKGAGFALTTYFRDCLACFRTVRGRTPEEQAKVIFQFVSTASFNKSYSKEEEARLKAIEDVEAARRTTIMASDDNGEVTVRDLEVLSAGVTVWQVAKKGKIQQLHLYF